MKIFGSKPLLNLALLLGLSSLGTVCLLLPENIAPTSNYSNYDSFNHFSIRKTEQVRSAIRQRNRYKIELDYQLTALINDR
jgi:hypothetical protein